MSTRNFADVIRAKLAADPALAEAVALEEAEVQAVMELKVSLLRQMVNIHECRLNRAETAGECEDELDQLRLAVLEAKYRLAELGEA